MNTLKKCLSALLVIFALFSTQSAVAISSKISVSPGSFTLSTGSVVIVQLRLNQPIICPSEVLPEDCKVEVDFSGNLPAGVVVDHSSVTWLSPEWSQVRTIRVSLDPSLTELSGLPITVGGVVDTGAPYYVGELPSFSIAANPTPAPTEDPSDGSIQALANTGVNNLQVSGLLALSFLMVLTGAILKRSQQQ
jgi:hypothetical protein